MKRIAVRAALVAAMSCLALLAPAQPAAADQTCTYCVYGFECSGPFISQWCQDLCGTASGACGDNGQCPGGFWLQCVGPGQT